MPQHPVSCPSQLDLHRAAHPTYQNHLSPPPVMFGTDAGWEQKSLLFNSSPGLGHVPSVPQFPLQPSTAQSELHQRSMASTTLPPPSLPPAPARGQIHRVTGSSNIGAETHLNFPAGPNPRPPPSRIQHRVYVPLPRKQETRYHAEGDSRAISEICYPHALNKIKLKVLLCCQDKGQAGEIIFHSQTLNYSLRLYQIQSK